jgi:hypothetical protein
VLNAVFQARSKTDFRTCKPVLSAQAKAEVGSLKKDPWEVLR